MTLLRNIVSRWFQENIPEIIHAVKLILYYNQNDEILSPFIQDLHLNQLHYLLYSLYFLNNQLYLLFLGHHKAYQQESEKQLF